MIALQKVEISLINNVIRFANLNTIKSTEQVENIFIDMIEQSISPKHVSFKELGHKSFGDAEKAGITAYENDQSDLQGNLAYLIEQPTKASHIEEWIGDLIEKVNLQATFENGKIGYRIKVPGVEAAYGFAVALLVDRGLAGRLRQCPKCGRFFIIYEGKKAKKKYCSDKCNKIAQRKNTANRGREFRKNKKD